MNHRNLINDAWVYSSNARAEDGLEPPRGWRALRDTVLIPLGVFVVLLVLALFMSHTALAQTGSGRIAGSVKDATGAVISGSSVTLTSTATSVTQTTTSNEEGIFNFPVVSIGQYELDVTASGFTPYKQTREIKIDVNTSLTIDVTLQVAQDSQTVTVTEGNAEVHTTDTQIGQTIESKQIVDIPLNGRSYTDLLAVQAGVTPVTTSGAGNSSSGGGFGTVPAAGQANTGQFSIHGQRESDNAYYLNGASVEETIGQQAGIIPNLDSIAEFRILSSNVDAEYGSFTGGIINVVTKSGTNAFHGNLFEFFRNTNLDARNYFSPERAVFHQNQYGGTFGGPIHKDKIFFFADYQGQRYIQGIETGFVTVPSLLNRSGNFGAGSAFTGTVNGIYLAQTLTQRLGYQVTQGEPFSQVFPSGVIPQRAWGTASQRMLQYIPEPNIGLNTFSSGAYDSRINDNKTAGRVDFNSNRFGTSSIYYFNDLYNLDNPYPSGLGGATLPGNGFAYDATSSGGDQVLIFSNIHTFGASTVNEARFGMTRLDNKIGEPKGGVGVTLQDQGIQAGGEGIVQGFPAQAGLEELYFNGFSVGTNPFSLAQVNDTYDLGDSVSRTIGNHTLKVGGRYIWYKVKQDPNLVANGTFSFFGSGNQTTGNGFADFLLGLPDFYSQQSSPTFYESAADGDLFAQDSFRVRPSLTLNYGLRWDYVTPWAEKYHQTTTFVQGVQSTTFPGAPLGYLVPGDPLPGGGHIPAGIAPTPLNNFSPRFGLAYSPSVSDGFISKLTGGPGKTSIRLGGGRFFTSPQGLTVAYPTGNPPYGLTYTSPEAPVMETPFIGALSGTHYIQQFPVNVPSYSVSPTNPDNSVDWSRYYPISGAGSVYYKNKTSYAMQYNLTIERQIGTNTLVSVGYIGSLGRHLLTVVGANPGNPALCLSLSQPSEVAPGSPTCGPFGENLVYTRADGTVVNGTRSPFPNTIGTDAYYKNMGNSKYNGLEVTFKHTAGPLSFLASYTYSKSYDQTSSIQEQVDPYDYHRLDGISAFDLKHDFVFSYNYDLPVDRFLHPNRFTSGWALSGITRFASGLPVTFASSGDNYLVQVQNNGVNSISIDMPNYDGTGYKINHNPRNGRPYFNTAAFTPNALGTEGNSKRRMFYGPGIDNYDMALHKVTNFTESRSLELRLEMFNVFNHAQFYPNGSVDGNIGDASFGHVLRAADPRIGQIAAKFRF
ncbi:TonB-dependent receptor [Alloacidobacterium dinghuense]|uniref:TonB-dependent receptor n=1 Tax=Alloacidobacterium dinghuense TaxID=2763107 RepID=A0A7G8BHQ3_9BACT|nr:carboxypeptidase regulatory-like domain-containing protein [Alloacidobacterium dinghuense]QNI32073.1 TonB-dependent receptor [Alloacidobacterium dinghuense]